MTNSRRTHIARLHSISVSALAVTMCGRRVTSGDYDRGVGVCRMCVTAAQRMKREQGTWVLV